MNQPSPEKPRRITDSAKVAPHFGFVYRVTSSDHLPLTNDAIPTTAYPQLTLPPALIPQLILHDAQLSIGRQ